jgi:hypothetical protein
MENKNCMGECTADTAGFGVFVLIPLALLGLGTVIAACSLIGTIFGAHGRVAAVVMGAGVVGLWLLARRGKSSKP